MRAVRGDGGRPLGRRRFGTYKDTEDVPLQVPERDSGGQREALQRAMTEGAGVLRTAESLEATRKELEALGEPADEENRNLLTVASALLAAAEERTETRGAHARSDHPQTDPALQIRLVLT
jgi:L-aspartate oxidase